MSTDIEAIRERLAAATGNRTGQIVGPQSSYRALLAIIQDDVPALLAEVERLQEDLAICKAAQQVDERERAALLRRARNAEARRRPTGYVCGLCGSPTAGPEERK